MSKHYRNPSAINGLTTLEPGDTIDTPLGYVAVMESEGNAAFANAFGPLEKTGMPSGATPFGPVPKGIGGNAPAGTYLVPATPANLAQNGVR